MATSTLDQTANEVQNLLAVLKSVNGFKISLAITATVECFIEHLESQNETAATRAGKDALNAMRNILGAFIRNSVMDRTMEGQTRFAPFPVDIQMRREKGLDPDLLARLEARKLALEEAVKTETNGSFELRIAAYNAMKAEIMATDDAMAKRMHVRREQAKWGQRRTAATSLRSLLA